MYGPHQLSLTRSRSSLRKHERQVKQDRTTWARAANIKRNRRADRVGAGRRP